MWKRICWYCKDGSCGVPSRYASYQNAAKYLLFIVIMSFIVPIPLFQMPPIRDSSSCTKIVP
jgi:hypothetical protein